MTQILARGRPLAGLLSLLSLLCLLAVLMPAKAGAAEPLPRLNIDPAAITVSGLSSGGFMAVQLGYAHAETFRGVGVFAAGPYGCAAHQTFTHCMYNAQIGADALDRIQADIDDWSGKLIADKARVAQQRVFLFIGSRDDTVGIRPVQALRSQYRRNGVDGEALAYVRRDGAAHVFPTDFDASGNNDCRSSKEPFISNCGYDGAKAVLTHLYGPLQPRNDAPAARQYRRFDQARYGEPPGMADTGWLFVPADCQDGERCRLHVALHGCRQSEGQIGERFVRNTGYTRWADSNRIVVLFPQTQTDFFPRSTAASGLLPNPRACFDWLGWYGSSFARNDGAQVSAIKAMVDRLASGGESPGGGSGGSGGSAGNGNGKAEPTCTTASNVDHVSAGRAYALAGFARAKGSNENMGLWNIFIESTLKQTAPGHYVLGTCH